MEQLTLEVDFFGVRFKTTKTLEPKPPVKVRDTTGSLVAEHDVSGCVDLTEFRRSRAS